MHKQDVKLFSSSVESTNNYNYCKYFDSRIQLRSFSDADNNNNKNVCIFMAPMKIILRATYLCAIKNMKIKQ